MSKWYKFKPYVAGNRQKLPPEKKWVLVMIKNDSPMYPHPVVVGYLKFAAGVKSEPYFVTPGASLEQSPTGPERVITWCDCLPETFEWPQDLGRLDCSND